MTKHGSTTNTDARGQRRAGDLDPAFGDGGLARVTLDFLNPAISRLLADGSILSITNLALIGPSEMIWAKHLSDGTLDANFGDGGILRFRYPSETQFTHSGFIVSPAGGVLLAGNAFDPTTGDSTLSFMKLSVEGAFDDSFGTGGLVKLDFPNRRFENVRSVSSQQDGRIVATGLANASLDVLFRLNEDGSLDEAFGNGGSVALPVTESRVSVSPDGKLLVTGSLGTIGLVSRYDENGEVDSQFGDGGRFEIVLEDGSPKKWSEREFGWVTLSDAAVLSQTDGRIVLVGSAQSAENPEVWTAWIARLNADGKGFDSEFNGGRPLMLEWPEGSLHGSKEYAVRVQQDGKIVSVGSTEWPTNVGTVRRFLADGTPDADFGQNGLVTTERVGTQSETSLHELDIQDDGKIVASGSIYEAWSSIAIYRFLGV